MVIILTPKDLVNPPSPPRMEDIKLSDFSYFHDAGQLFIARADMLIYHFEDRICVLKEEENGQPFIDSFENLYSYLT